jgi:hypothetical protein
MNDEEAIGLGEPVKLTRLRLANDQPIALEVTSLPGDILPDPQMVENSLYLELEKSGIRPVRAIQRISARNLTDEETRKDPSIRPDTIIRAEVINKRPHDYQPTPVVGRLPR